MVVDSATGDVLGESMADRGFAPASNHKLLTAAIAFESLGPAHRFVTRVATDVTLEDGLHRGRLAGNLWVLGGGDPTFAEPAHAERQWREIAAALRQAGIERVGGRVRGDASWFGGANRGHGWQWDYLADDYAAPFGGLCAAGNVLTLRIKAEEGHVSITMKPPLPDESQWFHNRVTMASKDKREAVFVNRALGQQVLEVTGVLRPAGEALERRVAVSDPVGFAEAVVTYGLQAAGMPIEGVVVPSSVQPVELARVSSPTVSDIAGPLLTNSNNLYAEQLFRGAARQRVGSAQDGAAREHAAKTLRDLGVDTGGLVMADGSGLSRRNLVQPRQLVHLLRAVRERPYGARFVACLPIAGVTGTLSKRFLKGAAHRRVRAKTGFISRVVCLSGYLEREDADPLIFSVMLNDFTCETSLAKNACDRFVQRLAEVFR